MLSRGKDPPCDVSLNGIRIAFNPEALIEPTGVETACFLANASLELRDSHLVNKGHLTLDPVAERVDRKGIGVDNDQMNRFDYFPDIG